MKKAVTWALFLVTLSGCGAGSARDVTEVQPPKLQGRMGLSAQARIDTINASNMSAQDKADRIAKIKAEPGSSPAR